VFNLGSTYVRIERQDEPAIRYSLGGSTNVYSNAIVQNRWAPIHEFRDATIEWSSEREAAVEGMVSFGIIGSGGRCRLRLIETGSGEAVAVSDWIGRPNEIPPLSERADVRFRMAIPRSDGVKTYRLEIISEQPNGTMVATGEIVFSFVRP
jgi:hypothetical protein